MKKLVFEGKVWCSVADAARYLGTNTEKIRALMGASQLRYVQRRKNGNLVVLVDDVVKLKYPGTIIMRVREH